MSKRSSPANLLYHGESAILLNPANAEMPALGFVVAYGLAYLAWMSRPGSNEAIDLVVLHLSVTNREALVSLEEALEDDPELSLSGGAETESVHEYFYFADNLGIPYEELDFGDILPNGRFTAERDAYRAVKSFALARLELFRETGDTDFLLPAEVSFHDD